MSDIHEHPMDDFPVRPLKFELANRERNFVWSRSSPRFAMFLNAFMLHVPYFERYLVKAMRKAIPEIDDPELTHDMRRIIGQEANHARVFIDYFASMKERYPEVARFCAENDEYFGHKAKTESLKQMVGYTAGYETFTFLAGAIILQNYGKWMADSDATLKAVFVWHQVEEVEHGAVAFDVYQKLYGDCEWYRRWMVVTAVAHMVRETLKAHVHMANVEGWMSNSFKATASISSCLWFLGRLAWNALPVLRKGYNPRRHPLVTRKQNPIQIAWRRYEKAGGDVLEINRDKMEKIMNLIPEGNLS